MATAPPDLPPSLATALALPPVPPKSWQDGVAPAYISLLLSVVFLDQLPVHTLFVGGLGPSIVGALIAGLFAYWMLYYAPAMWGNATRRPLSVVATSSFGVKGAPWVPGLILGVAQVIWFAIAINFATDYGLRALVSCGLLDPKHIPASIDGRIGPPGPLFLATAIVWSLCSAVIGTVAIRLVAAVMSIYPIFPALALGGTLVWVMIPWVMHTGGPGPIDPVPWSQGGGRSVVTMIQIVFGFLATYGLIAADWGAATKSRGDVRTGGLVGITLATPILACLSLLIVAGAIGREAPPPPSPQPAPAQTIAPKKNATSKARAPRKPATVSKITEDVPPPAPRILTLRDVFTRSIGGRLGTVAYFILALALLGPACYAPFGIARQFIGIWPKVARWQWSLAGAVATWPLLASGEAGRIDRLFAILGAIMAPAVAAISADYFRRRGRWEGPTSGVNWAGMVAWFVGMIVGLLPLIGSLARLGAWSQTQPSAVFAFLTAFVVYLILASIGLEPRKLAISELSVPPSERPGKS